MGTEEQHNSRGLNGRPRRRVEGRLVRKERAPPARQWATSGGRDGEGPEDVREARKGGPDTAGEGGGWSEQRWGLYRAQAAGIACGRGGGQRKMSWGKGRRGRRSPASCRCRRARGHRWGGVRRGGARGRKKNKRTDEWAITDEEIRVTHAGPCWNNRRWEVLTLALSREHFLRSLVLNFLVGPPMFWLGTRYWCYLLLWPMPIENKTIICEHLRFQNRIKIIC